MPTRPRIDFEGYHHIINRVVNRCNIFNSDHDKNIPRTVSLIIKVKDTLI